MVRDVQQDTAEHLGVGADVFEAEVLEDEETTEGSIGQIIGDQDHDAEQVAIEFLKKVLRLRGVRIDRDAFLRSELHKKGISSAVIDLAIECNPAAAGVSPAILDDIAVSSIDFETRKSSVSSFAAGVPGGFAMIGSVPADLTQFYVHAFRVMQKTAYLYGWQSFFEEADDVDDETLGKFAAFLGVMMGVGVASTMVSNFATRVARPAVQKHIAKQALTKTAWYTPMKQILRIVGVQVTKQSFSKTVSKVLPVVGGVVSGGLTMVTLSTQSKRLMDYLRELPPPNVDAEEYLKLVRLADEEDSRKRRPMGAGVGGSISDAVSGIRLRKGQHEHETAPTTIESYGTSGPNLVGATTEENSWSMRETMEGVGTVARNAVGKAGSILTRKKNQAKDVAKSEAQSHESYQGADQ